MYSPPSLTNLSQKDTQSFCSAESSGEGNEWTQPLNRSTVQPLNPTSHKNGAFTLAEVLITLGIIGVVAAMTLPNVVANAQKQAVAAKVHKFYNTINNTIQFAVADYGDVANWMGIAQTSSYENNVEFAKKYLLPYLKHSGYDNCYDNAVCVYMSAGGMFAFRYDVNGGDIFYSIEGKKDSLTDSGNPNARNVFAFQFNKSNGNDKDGNPIIRRNIKTLVEPYAYGWDGEYDSLINDSGRGCHKAKRTSNTKFSTYCTKLLQLNDWKITDDYPW